MEPLSPNDPLHALLGKARPVEPRPNFTQNVLRTVRQTPQSLSLWERVREWLGGLSTPRLALAGAAAVAVALMVTMIALQDPAPETPVVAANPPQAPVAPQRLLLQPAPHEVSTAMILAATAEVTVAPAATVAESQPDDMDPMGVLIVQQDTSALSDSELALLVY